MFTAGDVNEQRIQNQLRMLSEIGRQPSGGVTRYTFSDAHLQATGTVADWMAAVGLDVSFDRWGNLLGSTGKTGRMVLSGSHLDSVPNGGNYDGVLGVLTALEAITLIVERGIELKKGLGVVSFIEEEGARFHGLLGSKLAVGKLSDEEVASIEDSDGNKFLDVLGRCDLAYPVRDIDFSSGVDAFLELHIEQGKRLERAGIPIGVVTSIAGPTFAQVRLVGQADHAGATAYEDRRDSLLAAAEIIVAIRKLAIEQFEGRGHMTVGKIEVQPNVTNVIAGETIFNVDYRSADDDAYEAMSAAIREIVQTSAAKHRLDHKIDVIHHTAAVISKPHIQAAFENGARKAGLGYQSLVSWAAHDAMNMAGVTDAGMVFVPCRDGRSHTPEEYVEPNDVTAGVAVLANALLELAT